MVGARSVPGLVTVKCIVYCVVRDFCDFSFRFFSKIQQEPFLKVNAAATLEGAQQVSMWKSVGVGVSVHVFSLSKRQLNSILNKYI